MVARIVLSLNFLIISNNAQNIRMNDRTYDRRDATDEQTHRKFASRDM